MASRKKPVVGFVYSASSKSTTSGEDLAIYFGACLQIGGVIAMLIWDTSYVTQDPKIRDAEQL